MAPPLPSASTPLVAFTRRQARVWHVWLLSALVAACACRAYLYYYPDEQFSVIEFMSVKLGWTPATAMEWEFSRGIRPWLLPGAYYVLASALRFAGLDSRFGCVVVLRLATGALCVVAQVRLARWSAAAASEGEPQGASETFVREAILLTFLPYWFTRTSAETVSGALLALAWLAHFPLSGPAPLASLRGGRAFLAGLLFGLAFDVRPHTAAFAGGVLAWTLVHERRGARHWLSMAFGACCAAAILLVVDRWGYGRWVVSPYGYFVANLLEGVAKSFGTSPFYAYFYLLLQNPFAPLALYCEAVAIVAVARNPRHPLAWAVASFVLAHAAIGHKEDRFLFPLFPFLVVLFPLAFQPSTRSAGALRALRSFGAFGHAAGAVALGYMLLVPYGNSNIGTARAIERSARPDDPVLVVEGSGRVFARQRFYERAPWTVIGEADAVPASLAGQRVVHLVADDVPLPPGACPAANLHGSCVRRWSEFPGEDHDTHDRWLAFFESIQERLRARFAPDAKPHASWYAVYDFYPSADPGPGVSSGS